MIINNVTGTRGVGSVSYTHLDVYKRQASKAAGTIEDVIYATTPHNLPQDFTQDVIDFYYARQEIAEKYAVADCLYASSMENPSESQQTLVTLYKEARDTLTMCTSVSYTHLDVYKRQVEKQASC